MIYAYAVATENYNKMAKIKKKQHRIIIVDDDNIILDILGSYLRVDGHSVATFNDGVEAIKECKLNTYDLAILDIQMPGLNGIEVARRLDPLPVMFVSQVNSDIVIDKALEERALGLAPLAYINKPIDPVVFQRTVKITLSICDVLREKTDLIETLTLTYEREKKDLARDMHDHFGQQLLSLQIDLSLMSKSVTDSALKEKALYVAEEIVKINRDLKNIIHGLYPDDLELLGLTKCISLMSNQLGTRMRMTCDVVIQGNIDELSASESVLIYRIVQEALTNIGKHSLATRFSVAIKRRSKEENEKYLFGTSDLIAIHVTDNGVGFGALNENRKGIGLRGMRDRVKILGGYFNITSRIKEGTHLEILLPVCPKPA